MDVWWFFALFLALAGLAAGIVFRAGRVGRNRPWYRVYRDETSPSSLRYLPLGVLPYGIAFLLLVVSVPVFDASKALGALLLCLAFVFAAIGAWASHRAPEWAKPRWLRDEERDRGGSKPG